MSIPDNAVIRKAKNINRGDRVCFSAPGMDFVVDQVDHCSKPFPKVTFTFGEEESISTYSPDEFLYVVQRAAKGEAQ